MGTELGIDVYFPRLAVFVVVVGLWGWEVGGSPRRICLEILMLRWFTAGKRGGCFVRITIGDGYIPGFVAVAGEFRRTGGVAYM